jgi:hypothetical protein
MTFGERVAVRSEAQLATVTEVVTRMFREHGPILVTAAKLGKRSNDQNALMWVVVRQIAKHYDMDEEDANRSLLKARYGYREVPAGKVTMEKPPKSSQFSKAQMSDYISYMLEFAAGEGIKITMPDYWNEEY